MAFSSSRKEFLRQPAGSGEIKLRGGPSRGISILDRPAAVTLIEQHVASDLGDLLWLVTRVIGSATILPMLDAVGDGKSLCDPVSVASVVRGCMLADTYHLRSHLQFVERLLRADQRNAVARLIRVLVPRLALRSNLRRCLRERVYELVPLQQ